MSSGIHADGAMVETYLMKYCLRTSGWYANSQVVCFEENSFEEVQGGTIIGLLVWLANSLVEHERFLFHASFPIQPLGHCFLLLLTG